MTWRRTNIAYTTTLCEIFNQDDNCILQECRVCSYGFQDMQFIISYEIYEDEFDNQYYELCVKNANRDYILRIYAKDDLIAYEMFRELCSDKFISAFIEISYMYRGSKTKKDWENQMKTELKKFFNERNYKEYEVEFY